MSSAGPSVLPLPCPSFFLMAGSPSSWFDSVSLSKVEKKVSSSVWFLLKVRQIQAEPHLSLIPVLRPCEVELTPLQYL